MVTINDILINKTIEQAKNSSRKRKNFNFHEELSANVQRMLNAVEPETYIQPHKHENPDKVEAFIALSGKILVVEFDNAGNILEYVIIAANSKNYGVEIKSRSWHCIISLEPGSVVYEVKDGPYSPIDDKNFASWAPKEGDSGCADYNATILKKCGF